MQVARRGFSLTECLFCLAIIAVLAALLLPVLSRSKAAANSAEDISQFRQIYVASKLYEETVGAQVYDLRKLLQSGTLDKRLVSSRDDPTLPGIANVVAKHPMLASLPGSKPFDTRVSYISLGTFGYDTMLDRLFSKSTELGFLVSPTRFDAPGGDWLDLRSGTYIRLESSGAILHRRVFAMESPSGVSTSPLWLFADFEVADRRELIK